MNTSGYRKFLLLWTGELVSSIGSGLTSFGLTVYVFSQTGSAASTSLIALLAFLPTRGSASVIMISGAILVILSVVLYLSKSVKKLEQLGG